MSGWSLQPRCTAPCRACTNTTTMKAAPRCPQRVIKSSGWVGKKGGLGVGGCRELDGGCSFIKHLQDNLPSLSFSSIKKKKSALHEKSLSCLSTGFALSLNLCFLALRPCKLALVMSWNPVLNAAIKKGPWVPGRRCDRTVGVLKQRNARPAPQACTG